MINFCFDSLGDYNIGYPNLANLNLAPDEFDHTWPYSIPNRLQMYFKDAGIPVKFSAVETASNGSWYPISIGWHDVECDYFSLLSRVAVARLKLKEIKLLFYYHEGDNPSRIKQKFDGLCHTHNLPTDCYIFVSANSSAANLENFYFFSDHEHFFKFLNSEQSIDLANNNKRSYTFTALNRTHKWWRASCMSQLHHENMLDNSLWSYNTECVVKDDEYTNNPIEMSIYDRGIMDEFLQQGPYYCDSNDAQEHNDHRVIPEYLYTNSYCNLVFETLLDADQSNGAFVTEKTYKCIKFGQPFIIVGTTGSLELLRRDGYRTFDSVIDSSYDTITDSNKRWWKIKEIINQINSQEDLHSWYLKCLPDILHNQSVFNQHTSPALSALATVLTTNFNTV